MAVFLDIPAPAWVPPEAAPVPEAPPHSPPALTLVSAGLFLHVLFCTLPCQAAFYPFLNMSYPRCHPRGCWAQLCPAVGRLKLSETACFKHWAVLASPHRGHAGSHPSDSTLTCKTNIYLGTNCHLKALPARQSS